MSSFEPVEPISEAEDWTSLAYRVALDVGVNPINGNLLLRGPLVGQPKIISVAYNYC